MKGKPWQYEHESDARKVSGVTTSIFRDGAYVGEL
jgi:hypothetical protein